MFVGSKETGKSQRDGQHRRRETAMPEHPEINNRVLLRQLPDHKSRKPDNGNDSQADNDIGREPVQIFAFIQHDLQRTHPDNEQHKTDHINGIAHNLGFIGTEDLPADPGTRSSDRKVDQKDPGLTVVVTDPTPENRPEHRANQRGHRPDTGRSTGFFLGKNP